MPIAVALALLAACTPMSDLDSYTEGQPIVAAPSDASAPEPEPVPPEITLGPLQPSDAGADPADAAALDAGLDAGPECGGEGEIVGPDGQGCYRFVANAVSWSAASLDCQRWGGWLVAVGSAQEDAFLSAQTNVDVWLGLSDSAVEGQMVWVNGESSTYRNWLPMQPDNFGNDEDCVEKRNMGGTWNDRPCDGAPRAYFCER
jgi:hypothetical protein